MTSTGSASETSAVRRSQSIAAVWWLSAAPWGTDSSAAVSRLYPSGD